MFYSKNTNGFYAMEIHGDKIPPDAVEITDEDYAILMQGQIDGYQIGGDGDGYPFLIVPPPKTLPEAVSSRKNDLAAYRYDKEVGGITMDNGMKVATDDRSKGLIAGARIDIIDDPTILTDFKAETGWIQIDAATVTLISSAVVAHVRTCFAVEKQHSDAIDALAALPATTVADIEAYDITSGWPT